MPSEVQIKIKSTDETKQGFDSAAGSAASGAERIKDSVEDSGGHITGVADKLGHTGEIAAKMAVNIAQALGLEGKQAEELISIFRRVDDGFDAVGKAAHLLSVANAGVAGSNTAVAGTAGIAITAVRGLTAAMIANPITATLVAIGAAVAAVAVAYENWPKATENIEEMNAKLQKQQQLVERLLEAAQQRARQATNLEELEQRAAQKLEMKRISELKNVDAAEREVRFATERQEKAEAELRLQEVNLRMQVERLALLQKQKEEQHLTETSGITGLRNAEAIAETQAQINSLLEKNVDHKKQIANFEAQAEAAQDRAMALPEELQKKELERIEKTTKAEQTLAEKRAKFAADRLKAEDMYGTAIVEWEEEKKKALEDAEKEKKDKAKKDKKDDKGGPEFVGLEELGKNIQLAALKTNKEQSDRDAALALSAKQAAQQAELIELNKKAIGHFEHIAADSKITADKIEKVGTLV